MDHPQLVSDISRSLGIPRKVVESALDKEASPCTEQSHIYFDLLVGLCRNEEEIVRAYRIAERGRDARCQSIAIKRYAEILDGHTY